MRRNKLGKLFLSSLNWSFSSSGTLLFARFFVQIILARLLSPEIFGEFALIISFTNIFLIFQNFGISQSIIVGRFDNHHLLSGLFKISILNSIFVFLIYSFTSYLAIYLLDFQVPFIYFFIAGIVIILSSIGNISESVLKKKFKFKDLFFVDVNSFLISAIFGIILALIQKNVWPLLTSYIIFYTLRNLHLYFKEEIAWPNRIKFKESFRNYYSGHFIALSEFLNTTSSKIDDVIIAKGFGNSFLGYYSVAWNIMLIPLGQINGSLSKVLLPYYAKLNYDKDKLRKEFVNHVILIGLFSTPIYTLLYILSEEIILVFYGQQWFTAAVILKFLALIGISKTINNPGGGYLLSLGKQKLLFCWDALWLVLVVTTFYYFTFVEIDFNKLLKAFVLISIFSTLLFYSILSFFLKLNVLTLFINLLPILFYSFLLAYVILLLDFENIYITLILVTLLYVIGYFIFVLLFHRINKPMFKWLG